MAINEAAVQVMFHSIALGQKLELDIKSRLSAQACIYLPGSEGFTRANLRFTEYERPTYFAIVEPGCENDVVEVVKYAREQGIPFAARTGHHAVTTTMRNLKDGIMINMRPLNHIRADVDAREVVVSGGVITDELVRFLHGIGMEVNVGSCPTTGVVGVSFGAGLGRLQGKYGFLQDNMISCKLLLANGTIVFVSEQTNPELFWAIRGAGHNFCIALEVTFRIYPEANCGMHYTWDFEYSLDQCDDVFTAINKVYETMPAELAIFILWVRQSAGGRKHHILVNFVWSGKEEEADQWLHVFEALNPVINSGKTAASWPELPWTTYKGMNKLLSDPKMWTIGANKMMSACCVEKFDLKTIREFFESVKAMNEEWLGKGWFGAMIECLPHQRVREFADDSTAFPWRWGSNHFLMLMATPISMDNREAFEEHLDKWKETFTATSGYGRLQQYVNYGNTTSTMVDDPEAMYGYEPWRLEKLRRLKAQYDPDNVFRWYQPFTKVSDGMTL